MSWPEWTPAFVSAAAQPSPTLRMASSRVRPGARPNKAHREQYSSTVGVPCAPDMRSATRGCVTPIARATALFDGLGELESHTSRIVRMSSRSSSVHSRPFVAMEAIVQMERPFSNKTASRLDKLVENFTIKDMEKISTTLTAGQLAIETLSRLSASRGVTRETLAARLGVTRQTVTSRFRTRSMSVDAFIDTCDALDTDPAALLDGAIRLHESAPAPADPDPAHEGSR